MCVLFHYTSLSNFEKIIKSGSIYLFEVMKSNDPLECKFALDTLYDSLNEMYRNEKFEQNVYFNCRIPYLHFCEEIKIRGRHSELTLCTCFSECYDSIPMWRSYGNNGNGIAIGISKKIIEKFADKNDFKFRQITYNDKKQMKEKAENFWNDNYTKSEKEIKEKLKNFLYTEAFFIKEEGNRFEKEYRLLKREEDLKDYLLPVKLNEPSQKIDAITVDSDLKFYYKLEIEELKKINNDIGNENIGAIIIGPQCNITINELRLFMYRHNWGDFNILNSEIFMR